MTRPTTLDEARARLRRLDGGLRLDTERTPPSWTAYGYGVGRGDGETWEAAWDAMVVESERRRAVVLGLEEVPIDPLTLDHDDPGLWADVRALLAEQGMDLDEALRKGTENLQAWHAARPLPPSDDIGDLAGPDWPEGWQTVAVGSPGLRSALLELDTALAQPDRDLDPALYRVEKASAAVVREARAAADEIDALRKQVRELQDLGVSLHKAAAAGMEKENADIVAWLRSRDVHQWARLIERGAHRKPS